MRSLQSHDILSKSWIQYAGFEFVVMHNTECIMHYHKPSHVQSAQVDQL